jgi:hypothetical protein
MRSLAIIIAASLWLCLDCNRANAASVRETCAHLDGYVAKASAYGPPMALLTAVLFAESTCRVDAINKRTGARGPGQILPNGSAALDFSVAEITDPWLNVLLTSGHLMKCKRLCGTWRGAVRVYHGHARCSGKSGHADKVIRIWKTLERMETVRS